MLPRQIGGWLEPLPLAKPLLHERGDPNVTDSSGAVELTEQSHPLCSPRRTHWLLAT